MTSPPLPKERIAELRLQCADIHDFTGLPPRELRALLDSADRERELVRERDELRARVGELEGEIEARNQDAMEREWCRDD